MKTVKTANGFKKIEDWNLDLVPLQLRSILQEHRATLVDKLIHGGLATYIDYKFSAKIAPKQEQQILDGLDALKHSGIEMNTYGVIFDAVLKNEFTSLDNSIFYAEIDKTIRATLFQPRLFRENHTQFFQ